MKDKIPYGDEELANKFFFLLLNRHPEVASPVYIETEIFKQWAVFSCETLAISVITILY